MRGLAILMACLGVLVAATPAAAQERLSRADRAAINATLDVFVNHAVKRRDVAKSYDIVTPTLRGGMTRAQWSRGSIPVYPYPAAGRQFHEWTVQYRTREEVAIELILAPNARNRKKIGQYLFHVYLQPKDGRWLVDSFMVGATFSPEGKAPVVQAAGDFGATPGGQTYNRPGVDRESRPPLVSSVYLAVPFVVLGLMLLGIVGWVVVGKIRYARLVGSERQNIPPLRSR